MFEPGKITVLTGPRQSGRSLLAVDAAWHAANGRPWLGHLLPRPSCILTNETLATGEMLRAAILARPQDDEGSASDVLVMQPRWDVRSIGLMKGERGLVVTLPDCIAMQDADSVARRLSEVAAGGSHVIAAARIETGRQRGHSVLEAIASTILRVHYGMEHGIIETSKFIDAGRPTNAQDAPVAIRRFHVVQHGAGLVIRWAS